MAFELALGKFGEDSKKDFPAEARALELDFASYLKWTPKKRATFLKWLSKTHYRVIPRLVLRSSLHPEEVQDLMSEACGSFGDQFAFLLLSTGKKRFSSEQVEPFYSSIRGQNPSAVFFEAGEDDDQRSIFGWLEHFPETGLVLDPDQHRLCLKKFKVPMHFKLHGWHPDRWMRRYGESFSQRILKGLPKKSDFILILSHSGRIEEMALFSKGIRTLQE